MANQSREDLAAWTASMWDKLNEFRDDIPNLKRILDILDHGPAAKETVFEFQLRFQSHLDNYLRRRTRPQYVVGGVQEEREPGNDPGHDEDW